MNVFTADGRLAADAEVRNINGTDVCNFRIANNQGFGDRQTTLWVSCALWGNRGTALSPYLVKGQQVMVAGELSEDSYQAKDGSEGKSLKLRIADITLVGGREDMGGAAPAAAPVPNGAAAPVAMAEDDIPF
jgi:single-strand DNA-binding protein